MRTRRDRSPVSRRFGIIHTVTGLAIMVGCAACSSGPPIAGAGGGVGGRGNPPGGGGAAGEVAGPTCATLPALEPVLAGLLSTVHGLHVAGHSLFFVDTGAGTPGVSGATGGVRRLNVDGSSDGIVYVSLPGQELVDVIPGGDQLYILQQEMVGTASRVFLYVMPQVGGIPTAVSATSAGWAPNLVHFVAVDLASVYLVTADDVTSKARLTRVDLADGSETTLAVSATMRSAQLLGDTLWYYDAGNIYKVAARGGGLATQVGTISCAPRVMSVTSRAIVCGGGLGITRLDPLATMATNAVDLTSSDPGEVNPSPPDGTSVYVAPMPSETEGLVLAAIPLRGLRRLDDDGSVTLVSCDRGIMHDIVFGPTDVFWMEARETPAGTVDTQLFRLAK